MKRHLLLAISVLTLSAISQPLFAAETEMPAPREQAAPAERAPARERAARPTRERAPVQRQAAQSSSPSSSFTGSQASGFGGGNTGGGGFADPTWCGDSFSPSCPLTTQNISRSTGFIGGLEYGYLFPISPYWVVGWAADIAGSTLKSSNTQNTTHFVPSTGDTVNETLSTSQSQGVLSTWRLTAGFVPVRNWLVFATAGGAVGTVSGNFTYLASSSAGHTAYGAGSYNQIRGGYTAGGGVSVNYPVFGILGARVTLEYLYTDLGTVNQIIPLTPSCTGCTPGIAETSMRTDSHQYRLKVGLPL
jgi:hypothetical protein